jgi:M6 family metalloprotease-like protein
LPESILAFMVEFTDVQFDLVPDWPDSLAHNKEFYERLLFHNACYWQDASHGNYTLTEDNYTVWNEVLYLPHSMGYYGDDDQQIERVCEMVVDIVEMVDDEIDFNDFDALIIIHAGAGQETDLDGTEVDEIFSTFLSRRSLQAGIDPENDDFPGIETNDGIFLREFAIIPETANQPYFEPEDAPYGMMGIITHNFGHQIGLPTLFDNNNTNGASYGIGGFGIMGTGVWNFNGYVPPLPCAWSRYYLGWEDDNIIEIDETTSDLQLTFPMANDNSSPKIYKLNITDDEYFLIENRQQNPNGSMYVNTEGDTVVSFTFATIPNQPVYGWESVNAGQPRFMFMQNSYLGCEWDFFLPGYGFSSDPDEDGSGMLIWHIDENVIAENFDPDFENNTVNADASHKGVDLEEADGIQHLDSILYGFQSFYGSKNDAYREGNKVYFGKNSYQGIFSTPTAESYYGGIPLEVYDIGSSDSLMTFSVRYEWSLNARYIGESYYPATISNFSTASEYNDIFYPMPNGNLYLWENDELLYGYPKNIGPIPQLYAFDDDSKCFLVPCETDNPNICRLYIFNENNNYFPIFMNKKWAAAPVVNPDSENINRVFLPFSRTDNNNFDLVILDNNYNILDENESDVKIASNLMLKNDDLYFIDTEWNEHDFNLQSYETTVTSLAYEGETFSEILNAQMADVDADDSAEFIIVSADSLLHVFHQDGSYLNGYPVHIPLNALSLPSFADIDNNGFLDILIGGENTFASFDKNGDVFMPSDELENADTLQVAAGVIAFDANNDGKLDVVGNMSHNRFSVWENTNNNNFELNRQLPQTVGERSLNYPIIGEYSTEPLAAYLNCNNGIIHRINLPIDEEPLNANTLVEYCNLQRTACWQGIQNPAPEQSGKIFVKDETYFYPNPLGTTFSKGIDFGNEVPDQTIILRILTTKDVEVDIKVFDVAANKIYQKTALCENGVINKVYFDAKNLASGVYFAILKAKGKVLKLKFAVEK